MAARAVGSRNTIAHLLHNLGLCRRFQDDLESAQRCSKEALEFSKALGDQSSVAMALDNLADVEVLSGELDAARMHHREGLAIAREVGDRRRISMALKCVATLTAAEGQPERAVRLVAAADRIGEAVGATLAAAFEAANEPYLEAARRVLGEARAASSTAAGRALSLDEAVDEALAWLAEPEGAAQLGATPRHAEPPSEAA